MVLFYFILFFFTKDYHFFSSQLSTFICLISSSSYIYNGVILKNTKNYQYPSSIFCKLVLHFPNLLHNSPSYGYKYRFKYIDIESPITGNVNFDHLIIGISTLRLLFSPLVLKYLLRIYFIINVPFFLYDLVYLDLAWRSLSLCLCLSISLSICVCVCTVYIVYICCI